MAGPSGGRAAGGRPASARAGAGGRGKRVTARLRLEISAGEATPAYPVGPNLGPHGINIMDFVKRYNAATESMKGYKVATDITIFEDRSFNLGFRKPTTVSLLTREASIEHGSNRPNRDKVGQITRAQLQEVARAKLDDLNTDSLAVAEKMISGTARSMGITIVD